MDTDLKHNKQREFVSEKIQRWRAPLVLVLAPLLLISFVLLVTPVTARRHSQSTEFSSRKLSHDSVSKRRYVVVFDGGSSGSRVHVFRFNQQLDLVPMGEELELFDHTEPGLSSYANDPEAAAKSLSGLLEKAEAAVPRKLRHKTPVRLGATAGLRQLEGDKSDRILEAVRKYLKKTSSLKVKSKWITVLEGSQEGSFLWVTVNYLLGNSGKGYSDTVGVVDLGGGSVQMAYAISELDAEKAPKPLNGEESYVKQMDLRGKKYNIYVHSYLQYGLRAARAEILKLSGESGNPCVLTGYNGSYTYGKEVFKSSALPSGSSFKQCREIVTRVLKVNASCAYNKCTFGGVWNGGGGDGAKNLYVASFFYDIASEVGLINSSLPIGKAHPSDFEDAAKKACKASFQEGPSTYPDVPSYDLPYICMDLTYQFTLLVDGFGIDPRQQITLVKQVEYRNFLAEASWPLGSAIDLISQSPAAGRAD